MAGVAALSAVAIAGLCLAIYAAWLFHGLPDAGELADYRPPTATRVYSGDGALIGEIGQQKRIFTPYDQIPPLLVRAFLAAEDRKFFEHGGVDVEGVGRALTRDVFHLARGKRLEGGSTITQQVAKNVLLTNEASFGRKIKEAILAGRLEDALPKQRILELYLNEIALGNHAFGVAAAAQNYFGKPLNELTLAQMAYLAALPKGPNNYHPIRRRSAAVARRNWILGEMGGLGWASKAAVQEAMGQDLVVRSGPEKERYRDADYFVEETRLRALGSVGKEVDDGGFYIRTTLDARLQTAARIALMRGLEAYDHRHGWRGGWGHVELQPGWEAEAMTRSAPAERRTWRAAAVDKVSGGRVHVVLPSGGAGDLDAEDVAWARRSGGFNVGDLIWVEPIGELRHTYNLRQAPAVNGALVALEPRSGRVLAMVGGYSFSLSKFNRATQAKRQPGSAFKPFVYATALENGFTPASVVMDAPISFPGWSPSNYSGRSAGRQIFRNGLVYSRNQMTVRIAQRVGMKKIRAAAIRDGVVDDLQPYLPSALGATETTPFRLTGAYAAFANGGRRVQPHLIELVEDRKGKRVFAADHRDCRGCNAPYTGQESPRLTPPGEQVMDPVTAYAITLMLQGVTTKGTAKQVAALGRPIAGKTGTTNEYRSAWFVGYTPSLVVGTFIGFDDNRSLGDGETGGTSVVPIFMDFMKEALKDQPVEQFRQPKTADMRYVRGNMEAFLPPPPKPKPPPGALNAMIPSSPAPVAPRASKAPAPAPRQGPIPYEQAFPGGRTSDEVPPADGAGAPPAAAPPPPKPPPKDMTGLY